MIRKIVAILSALSLAFFILFISVMRAASVNYAFYKQSTDSASYQKQISDSENINIDYFLAYPGKILPDHPLWPLKALRDKIWLTITVNSSKKAELKLLFADKRLSSSLILFEAGKPELAFSTFSKGEKYLEESVKIVEENSKKGMDTTEQLTRLINASFKHRQVIAQILKLAPEDAKPGVIKIEDYSINVYKIARDILNSKGIPVPENPFNGD